MRELACPVLPWEFTPFSPRSSHVAAITQFVTISRHVEDNPMIPGYHPVLPVEYRDLSGSLTTPSSSLIMAPGALHLNVMDKLSQALARKTPEVKLSDDSDRHLDRISANSNYRLQTGTPS